MHTTAPPVGAEPRRWAMFSALRYRNYRFYWLGQFPSVLAQNMQHVALAWLVYDRTSSPALLGVTGLVQTVPNIAFSFLGGAMADRVDRKRLLLGTQGAQALLFLGLGTLVVAELAHIWAVLALAFLLGCVRAFDQPARQAILPLAVPEAEIPNAVPLGNLVWSGTRIVGPAAAGLLLSVVGIGQTFYVAALGFGVALGLFARLRLARSAGDAASTGLLRNMVDGIIYIRKDQIISAIIGLTFFNSVFGMSYTIMLAVFARDILEVGVQGLGFLEAAGAIGSIAATFGVAAFARSRGNGWRILVGAAIFGALIIGFSISTSFVLSLGLLFLMGAASQVYMTLGNTALQLRLPNEFRGRVMGVWGLTWSLLPLGGTISGGIAEYAGAPIALAIGGALVTLMSIVMAVALPRMREL